MVDPKIMCRQHLLGEHLEIHMFVGVINNGKKIGGFVKKNLLEISSLLIRHDELVGEMVRRKYNHRSPLKEINLSQIDPLTEYYILINTRESLNDLLGRCKKCKENYEKSNTTV